ncbi:dTDP-glucose 4,6-dehydratase [Methanolobus vulcani]|jgi:Nucleoside-diphosphate-sugar epimerases|uniref:dTDP-glucose 4,6-dehydratase n=1 Tax=Methanolobus vulcani TaxID=38026 RepID=A0A7Z7AYI8_9EURY|nr:SDR family NAD(P)-dependent oxidoreductase [Methanolobus vulcani]SDF57610.1 dTDP-glucose 4,6-dehydratase [Methanolobus vulcani]
MNILVTGGAGFIGRWVVKRLLDDGNDVLVLDDLSNGREQNISEFQVNPSFSFVEGDIKDSALISKLFSNKLDICIHLAASIIVQDSIDDPRKTFENDVIGTFNVLEEARKHGTKIVFMSTCMVYDLAKSDGAIGENHPTKPASPYAGAKLAGENMVQSYYHAYGLPTVILRPFNTYGPFQKSTGEGGVVAVFLKQDIEGEYLNIYGDGTQTRDLMYVEDCADFLVRAAYSDIVNGELLNAGLGKDITINDLASIICGDSKRIKHVEHIHPQSEIAKLVCDNSKAYKVLEWKPETPLEEGIEKTRKWLKQN